MEDSDTQVIENCNGGDLGEEPREEVGEEDSDVPADAAAELSRRRRRQGSGS